MDTAGVIERLAWTISLIAREATPMARAMEFCEIPIGSRLLLHQDLTRCDRVADAYLP